MPKDYEARAKQYIQRNQTKQSPGQNKFLELLLNDCGYRTRGLRNECLSREVGRTVRYLDDLSFAESSRLIESLTLRRDELRESSLPDIKDTF